MTDLQSVVLEAVNRYCSANSGYATGGIAVHIGRQLGHESNRQHSALVGAALRHLADTGRIRVLDDRKPVIWTKVA